MQAFLGAINYCSRFSQNIANHREVLYQLKEEDFVHEANLSAPFVFFDMLQQRIAKAPILLHFDSASDAHVALFASAWALSSTLMQIHDGKLHPVRFCGRF